MDPATDAAFEAVERQLGMAAARPAAAVFADLDMDDFGGIPVPAGASVRS